jgi:hypothetical protein
MAARPGDGAGYEDPHPSHSVQGDEGLVTCESDLDLTLYLAAQLPQRLSRCRKRAQLIDDYVTVAVHRVTPVAVVLPAMDRDSDLVTRTEQIVVLRRPEGGSRSCTGPGESFVAEEPQLFAGPPAECSFKRVVLPSIVLPGLTAPGVGAGTSVPGFVPGLARFSQPMIRLVFVQLLMATIGSVGHANQA